MISLRPHIREDVPLRIKWLNNKNANTFLTDNPTHVTDSKEQNEWFDRYEADANKRFYTILADETPIGFTGISNINTNNRSASVFIVIGEDDFRGKGNGKTILDLLLTEGRKIGVETFALNVFKNNIPAVRLYTNAGFVKTKEIDDSMITMELSL